MDIPIDKILPNPTQPRKVFSETELQSLADSLRINGQLQSIMVEQCGDHYILIAGERRCRAAKLAGLKTLRAEVCPSPASDSERLVLALVENVQRSDMQPVDEARGYQALRDMGLSLNTIAHRVGKSHTHIVNRLKLLELDGEIQDLVNAGQLPTDIRSTSALLSVRDPELRINLAHKLARPGQSIKTVEAACRNLKETLSAAVIKHEIPALHVAAIHSHARPEKPARWDALKSLGRVPPWEAVTEAARATCNACSLREVASDKQCRECPAVDILRYLIHTTQGKQ